jgi:predicted transcriptional regulator
MEEQKKLFDEFQKIGNKIGVLKSFVQSDLKRLLDDGFIKKEDIENSINALVFTYDECTKELSGIYKRTIIYMYNVLKEYNK